MKILISGACGYVGSTLCRHLLESNLSIEKLTAYDNLLYKQTSLLHLCYKKNFEFVHDDVRNHEVFLKYLKEADVVIPLAAFVGFPICEREKYLATQVNYEQIKFIVDNTSKNQKIIFPNTNSGYGIGENNIYCDEKTTLNPISHYGIVKTMAERDLMNTGRAVSLRLATVFGVSPRMRLDLLVNDFTYKAISDGYIVLFEKDFKRNYIHVQDVAKTFIFMLENYDKVEGEVFNVGLSDANLSKLELAETIKKFVPDFIIQTNEFKQDPDKRNYIVSNKKIESFGWKPDFSLEDGIQELLKAYKMILHDSRGKYTNL